MKHETRNLKPEIVTHKKFIFHISYFILLALCASCTFSPKFAPVHFSPLIEVHDSANGSANGNTVTPVAP